MGWDGTEFVLVGIKRWLNGLPNISTPTDQIKEIDHNIQCLA